MYEFTLERDPGMTFDSTLLRENGWAEWNYIHRHWNIHPGYGAMQLGPWCRGGACVTHGDFDCHCDCPCHFGK